MSEHVSVNLRGKEHNYEILIGNGLLSDCGRWAKSILQTKPRRIAVVTNEKVFSLYGEIVFQSLANEGFEVVVWKMGDGESFKSLETAEAALSFFSESRLTRSDAVIALGGGVVGDLTGFASAIYLRGISFLQIPTTLLSMIDSSVGGKTGVNSSFGKNLIGAFHQPNGVLIDVETLATLETRELTAGFCEAAKHGAIGGRHLLDQTAHFLRTYPPAAFAEAFGNAEFPVELERVIAAQVNFKASIVKNDEFESLDRKDVRSRKILNFGHTVGHALEKVTNYEFFKHGEAVGLGMIAAGELSKNVANLGQDELNLLNDVVNLTGRLPDCRQIDTKKVVEAFSFDKKNIGSSLQWILLEAIGKPVIVAGETISREMLEAAIGSVLTRN